MRILQRPFIKTQAYHQPQVRFGMFPTATKSSIAGDAAMFIKTSIMQKPTPEPMFWLHVKGNMQVSYANIEDDVSREGYSPRRSVTSLDDFLQENAPNMNPITIDQDMVQSGVPPQLVLNLAQLPNNISQTLTLTEDDEIDPNPPFVLEIKEADKLYPELAEHFDGTQGSLFLVDNGTRQQRGWDSAFFTLKK